MSIDRNLIIIFGTTRGLGRALLRQALLDSNNDIVLVNRRKFPTHENNKNIIKNFIIDLSTPLRQTKIDDFLSSLPLSKRYKNIFFIGNASSIKPIKPVGRMTSAEIHNIFFTNILNYTVLINAFIRKVSKFKNSDKKVLMISSGAADSPHHGLSLYCATKAALEMLVQSIFIEQQTLREVKISAVRPGVLDTSMQTTLRSSSRKNFAKITDYRSLKSNKILVSPKQCAKEIYSMLFNDRFWSRPVNGVLKDI